MAWSHEALDERVLVTGASGGIGAAVVRRLAAVGCTVLAVARRDDALARLARASGCATLAADVRDSARLRDAVAAFAPTVLVNNAGVGHGIAGLATVGEDAIREAIETNVTAPIVLTSLALDGMRARGAGHIVNIGSIAGLHTLASAVYGAGKAALHRFSQNLRRELHGSGLRVTEICPGRVSSGFYAAAAGDPEALGRIAASGMRELQPDDIAEAVLFALRAPAHVNVSTIEVLPTDQAVGGVVAAPARA